MSQSQMKSMEERKLFTASKEIDGAETRPDSNLRSATVRCMWLMQKDLPTGFMPSSGKNMPKVQESKPLRQHVQNKRPAIARGQ